MTDREQLELAAKAAGIDNLGWLELSNGIATMSTVSGVWNPLTDDGDALRLAVKLEISVWQAGETAVADHDALGPKMRETHSGDPYAATRRAIVRAAAEIGKDAMRRLNDAAEKNGEQL